MKPWITGTIAGLLLLVGSSFSAMAELSTATATTLCAPTTEMEEMLATQYGETKVAGGTAGPSERFLAVLWVNEDEPSWSFVLYNPVVDTACIFAAGGSWDKWPTVAPIVDPASTY